MHQPPCAVPLDQSMPSHRVKSVSARENSLGEIGQYNPPDNAHSFRWSTNISIYTDEKSVK